MSEQKRKALMESLDELNSVDEKLSVIRDGINQKLSAIKKAKQKAIVGSPVTLDHLAGEVILLTAAEAIMVLSLLISKLEEDLDKVDTLIKACKSEK